MADFGPEQDSIELAIRCVEQIHRCIKKAAAKAERDPGGAKVVQQSARRLFTELRGTQATVEELADSIRRPSEIASARK
jgi:hypothetical protein